MLPVWIVKKALNYINNSERKPAVIYFHPWEIDNEQPRIRAGLKSHFRHYLNIDKTESKIRYLLSSFRFCPMGEVVSPGISNNNKKV